MNEKMYKKLDAVNEAVEKLNTEANRTNYALSAATAQAVANKTEISGIKKKLISIEKNGIPDLDKKIAESIGRQLEEARNNAVPSNVNKELDRKKTKELDKIKAV